MTEANLLLEALGEVASGRVGGERQVGDVFPPEKLGHRAEHQVTRVGTGHVVVRVALVKVHHAVPFVAETISGD